MKFPLALEKPQAKSYFLAVPSFQEVYGFLRPPCKTAEVLHGVDVGVRHRRDVLLKTFLIS